MQPTETLYAAILIPLVALNSPGFNVTNSTNIRFPAPPPFPEGHKYFPEIPNENLPVYGYLWGQSPQLYSWKYQWKNPYVSTNRISLLDCPGNHNASNADDDDDDVQYRTRKWLGKAGPEPPYTEDQVQHIRKPMFAKQRFWECLDSKTKSNSDRIKECLCMELGDFDPKNPFAYPSKLGPRAYDTDNIPPEFRDYWQRKEMVLCGPKEPDAAPYDVVLDKVWARMLPVTCRELDIYDVFDEFKAKFFGKGEEAMSTLYKVWRDSQDGTYDGAFCWDLQKRMRVPRKSGELCEWPAGFLKPLAAEDADGEDGTLPKPSQKNILN
ncbi:hypothetical protein BJ508DRAFT_315537 [Ascobolus immersus RN42]|uniref:Uncharacterized protein n=1 Tax=Ascobolus immersus RN42 TaxID=1160509 RepID=A0A3N4HF56_ASCIM|nr:hypothetical protein BJ508DRAFT_315537 [Ascobolus immersus RN42]